MSCYENQTGYHKGTHCIISLSEWLATGLLTELFKLLFSVCHEEKKAADAINKRNKEIDKQQEEAKTLFDEIAKEIELACAQGTIFIIRTLLEYKSKRISYSIH